MMKKISVAILHANSTFRQSLTKVLNYLGFNCIPIPIEPTKSNKIEEGQKWIRKNITQLQEGILLLHLDPSVDTSENHAAQDLIRWILHKELQIPIVLMAPNYLDSQQDNMLNCPTCNKALEMVSYPAVELSKLLAAIHKASATKGLPQHDCLGISFFNPKRHNIRLGYYIYRLIHNELKNDVPEIIEAFDKDFRKNLWYEFYGKILKKISKLFDAFHFEYEQILSPNTRDDLREYSKNVEQMILSDDPRDIKGLNRYIEEKLNWLLVLQVCDNYLDYEKNSSVLEHYDENKALHFGKTFNEKEVRSELKTKVTQLQGYFIRQDYKAYWQCRFETEWLLINLDVAPAFYFLDEVESCVRCLIVQQTKMLKPNVNNFSKKMTQLEKSYKCCMKLLEDEDEI